MATDESVLPKWVKDDRPLYDTSQFQYYREEDEPDEEYLNDLAKELGLPKSMYENDENGTEVAGQDVVANFDIEAYKNLIQEDFDDLQDKLQLIAT